MPGQFGLHPFWLAHQLWRLDPVRAFATVVLPGPHHDWPVPRQRFHLDDRADRARTYEIVLREGGPMDMLDYIDGALLIDIWHDLELPDPIRRAWQPLIGQNLPKRRREREPKGDGPPGALIRLRPSQRSWHLGLGQKESEDDSSN